MPRQHSIAPFPKPEKIQPQMRGAHPLRGYPALRVPGSAGTRLRNAEKRRQFNPPRAAASVDPELLG